jgi:hypothetical protein
MSFDVDTGLMFRYQIGVASKPKSTAPYSFDPASVGPSPPPIGFKRKPRHYVKATACGKAKRSDDVTSRWDEVDCPACLGTRPKPR